LEAPFVVGLIKIGRQISAYINRKFRIAQKQFDVVRCPVSSTKIAFSFVRPNNKQFYNSQQADNFDLLFSVPPLSTAHLGDLGEGKESEKREQ